MFELSINNFRSFKEQTFNFKRVNILIGENSSGKSSLMKFLLMLKQTIETPKEVNLSLNGELVDLGNFKEVIYYHKTKNHIAFEFKFHKAYSLFFFTFRTLAPKSSSNEVKEKRKHIESLLQEAIIFPTSVKFELSEKLHLHEEIKTSFHNPYLGELFIEPSDNESADHQQTSLIDELPKCRITYKSKTRGKDIILENIEFEKRGFLTIIMTQSLRDAIKNDETLFEELAFLLVTQNFIGYNLDRLTYINPIKNSPQRFYYRKDIKSTYSNIDLEKFIELIRSKRLPPNFIEKLQDLVHEYGIATDFKVISANNLPVQELRVKIKNLFSNIHDVGYGVSLQLPVLFEAMYAEIEKKPKTFLIEQPEVHLHPKLQAKFIDTLLKMGNRNNYIIETHSEHIIRMLQLIVKEKKHGLKSEDISIHYFRRGDKEFTISEHPILPTGQLNTPFPPGFFDTSYELAKKLIF